MAETFDINLPKDHQARFPDQCIACGRATPGDTVRLATGAIGWWSLLLVWGKPFSVRVPACAKCGWRLHLRRIFSTLISILLAIAVFFLLWPLVKDSVPRALRTWAVFGMAIPFLLIQITIEEFWPPPIDITALSKSVDYEFRDRDKALEFAALNTDAEWVKIDA